MAMKTISFKAALVFTAAALLPLPAVGQCPDDKSAERRQEEMKNRTEQAKETADSWFSEASEELESCVSGISKPTFGASDGLPNNLMQKLMDEACNVALSEVNGTIDSTMSEIDGASGGVSEATGGLFDVGFGTTTGSVDSGSDLVDVDVDAEEPTKMAEDALGIDVPSDSGGE